MDSIVTQGKELGIYFYMMTGGEPMVRKKDIIELCRKHNDCVFFAYTNGTLVDEALCKQMQEVGNLFLALSVEASRRLMIFAVARVLWQSNACHGSSERTWTCIWYINLLYKCKLQERYK